MQWFFMKWQSLIISFLITFLTMTGNAQAAAKANLLNVSYDATRELYQDYNILFARYWAQKTGQSVTIEQSHGGSATQAHAVINGLNADVVTLGLAYDIDMIAAKTQWLPLDWQSKLPNKSCPYTSTIVFLVRKGNPKHIRDWSDLMRPDVQVITPNPKTSSGARWAYLAAWGYALRKNNGNEAAAINFMRALFKKVPILATGARSATITFSQDNIGDVLISWENEAFLIMDQLGKDKFALVAPSLSILAEPPVAVVEKNARMNGDTKLAKAYLNYLYSKDAQELLAKHYYRPADPEIAAKYKAQFPHVNLFTVDDLGGWQSVQKKHFDDGGIFDQIYQK